MVKVGDFIEGEEVLSINKLQLIGSQPNSDNNEWEFYQIITTFNKGTYDTNELFICYLPVEEY